MLFARVCPSPLLEKPPWCPHCCWRGLQTASQGWINQVMEPGNVYPHSERRRQVHPCMCHRCCGTRQRTVLARLPCGYLLPLLFPAAPLERIRSSAALLACPAATAAPALRNGRRRLM